MNSCRRPLLERSQTHRRRPALPSNTHAEAVIDPDDFLSELDVSLAACRSEHQLDEVWAENLEAICELGMQPRQKAETDLRPPSRAHLRTEGRSWTKSACDVFPSRSMKAYQVRAPKSKPNLRIRRPKERKLSAEEKRERESPGYLDKIRMLPCCIPSCNEPAPSHAHHLKCTGERGIGKKSLTNGRSRFAMNAISMALSASEAVRKPHGSGKGASSAWTSLPPFMPTRTVLKR